MAASTIHKYLTVEELAEHLEIQYHDGNAQLHWIKPRARWIPVGARAGYEDRNPKEHTSYRRVGFTCDGRLRNIKEHVAIYALHHGYWPVLELDHIDRNGLNNHPDNLRQVSPSENARNKRVNVHNKLGVTGVMWVDKHPRRPFKAYLFAQKSPGVWRPQTKCFKTLAEAVAWREQKLVERA
jgi:hypothetical protein